MEKFKRTLEYDNIYDDEEPTYEKTFPYCFEFNFRNKLGGTALVYRGGFYIEFSKQYLGKYKSSHCNHFSMPMCQHFTAEGAFTQFFIDRITEVLQRQYDVLDQDEIDTKIHYLNQGKGRLVLPPVSVPVDNVIAKKKSVPKKSVPKKSVPKKSDKATPKKSKELKKAATVTERPLRIVTKASDKKLFDKLSQRLTNCDEPFTGGLSEWSQSPCHSGVDACVYTLHWSKDRLTVGLEVEVYHGPPPPDNIENGDEEESDNDDFDPYISAIDDGDSTSELEAIAILEPGEEYDPESLVWELEEVHHKAGGTTITDPRF